jgi:cellulose synthase/poly-beta-1,6-N-acetylglucosamine synthase-like glycosyltransferase
MYDHSSVETLKYLINTILVIVEYLLVPFIIYQFVISVFGLHKRKEESADNYAPANRFALIVAAHDEEAVVGSIVRNLKGLEYPEDMFDIYVVADNCGDGTAKVASENGAQVFERFDTTKNGKGFALAWAFEKLFKMDKKYDAIGIFDADNLVSPNFLKEMNKYLCKGHKVVQGYLDSKNPSDTWVSGNHAIAYWISNRIFQLPRYYLGLSCALGGTGFIMSTDILKEIGWKATCLTEDLEFSLQLVLKGERVAWCNEAVVYDEKPLGLAQSWRQRKRWMQGQSDCAYRYLKPLLTKAVKDRDMRSLDSALYLIQPLVVVLGGMLFLAKLLEFIFLTGSSAVLGDKTILLIVFSVLVSYITIVLVFVEGKLSSKIIEYFVIFPLFGLTWIPIIIQGFLDRNKTEWSHTLHTRALDIKDIEKLERA